MESNPLVLEKKERNREERGRRKAEEGARRRGEEASGSHGGQTFKDPFRRR